jgi:transcription antitermination factor NusG
VFVNIAEHKQSEVLMTKGVSRFLYFSGKPAAMPDRQITELKLLMSSSFDLEITEEDLHPGERIIIKAGALKGMTGEVVSRRSQKQLILRLESLGCSIIVHVAASYIERL